MAKCYYVYDKNDGYEYNEFVWAETKGKAKYKSHLSSDIDWTDLKVKRVPKLDNTPYPTDKQFFEAGFWVSCNWCHKDGIWEPVFNNEDDSFCDEVCLSAWRVMRQKGLA